VNGSRSLKLYLLQLFNRAHLFLTKKAFSDDLVHHLDTSPLALHGMSLFCFIPAIFATYYYFVDYLVFLLHIFVQISLFLFSLVSIYFTRFLSHF